MINEQLTSITKEKNLLLRNVVMNFAGQGLPMIVALFAIPILIKSLGIDRFGVLTLIWVVVGYFSLFDIGLGRTLTKLVAENIGKGQEKKIPSLIGTALMLMGGVSLVGVILLLFLTPWLVNPILNIPGFLRYEASVVFYILAFSIPIVITTTGLRGILEAYQRFDIVNAIRIPMGLFTFLGPLAVLPFSKSLVAVVSVLVLGRMIACIVHLICCFFILPRLKKDIDIERSLIRPMISFGGWLTVSNIVGPLLLYADRFFIASLISVSAVAYYTTPYEMTIKLLIIPGAILGVMFPAFSSSFSNNSLHAKYLYNQTMKYISFIMLPIVGLICYFSKQGLALWLGADFASNSFRVAQLLTIGVLINSYGHISQSLIQATGRPDITAKLHMFELPSYLIYLKILVSSYGIIGASFAWVIRVSISTIALSFIASRILKGKL